MSDDVKAGFLEDAEGNKSSGRLIKVASFFVAIFFAITGSVLMFFSKEAAAVELGKYMLSVVAMFLGVATSAEVIQKLKNL